MTETDQDFTVPQRNARTVAITVTDDAGDPEDVSNFDIEWRLSDRYGDTALVSKGPNSADITVTGTDTNVVEVFLSGGEGGDTDLGPGEYTHELRVTDGNGDPYSVTQGTVTVFESSF
jgi:hypothetical protein